MLYFKILDMALFHSTSFRLLLLSILPLTTAAGWDSPPKYRIDEDFEGYVQLTPPVLAELRQVGQRFITFSGGPGCHLAQVVGPYLLRHQSQNFPEIPLFLVTTIAAEDVLSFAKPLESVPLILVFEGGRLVDGQLGIGGADNGGLFDALLIRQGLPPSGVSVSQKNRWMIVDEKWTKRPVNRDLSQHTLAKVDARNLDLRGVLFTGSLVTHSDFSGARVDAGALENTLWIDSICPDGSHSDAHEYSCSRH